MSYLEHFAESRKNVS